MHELGASSAQMHEEIGQLAVELGIDHFVAIGNRDYLRGLKDSSTVTHYFGSVNEAEAMISEFEPGDVVLVKASRAEHLETLAETITQSWVGNEGEKQ
jgi:UDP-N-acetylmuramoyl-tripeptide--D-alanyl-D-alanine ligase